MALALRPIPVEAGAAAPSVAAIDVGLNYRGLAGTVPTFRLPLVTSNVETAAPRISVVQAMDARGALEMIEGRQGAGDAEVRTWTPNRPVEGELQIRYRAPMEDRMAPRGAAPPLELRSHGLSFSGAGSSFLLLPENSGAHRISIDWDLSALPNGGSGYSSLGRGRAHATAPQPLAFLQRSFFMAGRIGYYPDGHGSDVGKTAGFHAAWQGDPPFDVPDLMRWTQRLHARYTTFFRLDDPPPYTVFLRPNPVNAGGGVGMAHSFVTTFDGETDGEELKGTLSHEMFHTFAPRLARPEGLESSWFSEGLAVYYGELLPVRFGEAGPDDFIRGLNSAAARYYSSLMAEVPNAEIPARFWEDTRIRTLPYDRGALYFADLDHRVRTASEGRRSLDDLLLRMVDRERSGEQLGPEDWEGALDEELGPEGVQHFRDMLAGKMPLPASEAFGPCFRRTARTVRRYELGFDPKVLVEPRRIVRGLVPGSAAEQAGLREGDEIVRPVPQDSIQGDQQAMLRLQIRRGDQEFPLSYLPRGEPVNVWQWERIADVPDSRCGL